MAAGVSRRAAPLGDGCAGAMKRAIGADALDALGERVYVRARAPAHLQARPIAALGGMERRKGADAPDALGERVYKPRKRLRRPWVRRRRLRPAS